jgi:myo-inositol-1-phosphate synthase
MAKSRVGVWLIGARGGVASTAIVGLLGLQRRAIETAGLVSELPYFSHLGLVDWNDLVIGGHEIREVSLVDEARRMVTESRAIDSRLIDDCKEDLARIDANIRPGALHNVGKTIQSLASPVAREARESPRDAIDRLQKDFQEFLSRERLERLVVVNLASTEPQVDTSGLPSRWSDLAPLLHDPKRCTLSASSLYAIAAMELGHPFINFTPSVGSTPAAICDLALERSTCHTGRDGKTGETLLKSVLAPMFAKRNLHVMSWVGHNIFGNLDGKVLNDPSNKQTKVTSKDKLLGQIFGYHPQTLVSIEYIESLGDWKTAWDHVHFRGFLGTPMTFQFVWQGCDSLLAAPLVLDLVRLTERAHRAGETGVLTFLASFFKSPMGTTEHDFGRQFATLLEWTRKFG